MANTFTTANFNEEVLQSDIPVLVDFWASWCMPCKMLTPVIEELAEEAEGYKVGKVNVDEEPELARQYNVMSIPTVLVFKGGQVVKQSVGVQPKEALEDMVRMA
ncbi:MAG TPA: thioredoxin [Candidatus Pullilachnospira stercoravium]|uniref:Thioredoxin n=1 Tax=Candidatus Pullilachnospira stercoravium TaxID=2840913 RepID=A0A9D1NXJ3_9FIRM|nr:thioredoxin [Candidatus Pullilachnospira stercoravium]